MINIYIRDIDGIERQVQYVHSIEQAEKMIVDGIMPKLKAGYKYIIK